MCDKEEKDGVEKAICSQIIKNCDGQVHTPTQPCILRTCKHGNIAACVGTEALRLDCIGHHALALHIPLCDPVKLLNPTVHCFLP